MGICSDSPPAKGHGVRVGALKCDPEKKIGFTLCEARCRCEENIWTLLLYISFAFVAHERLNCAFFVPVHGLPTSLLGVFLESDIPP